MINLAPPNVHEKVKELLSNKWTREPAKLNHQQYMCPEKKNKGGNMVKG